MRLKHSPHNITITAWFHVHLPTPRLIVHLLLDVGGSHAFVFTFLAASVVSTGSSRTMAFCCFSKKYWWGLVTSARWEMRKKNRPLAENKNGNFHFVCLTTLMVTWVTEEKVFQSTYGFVNVIIFSSLEVRSKIRSFVFGYWAYIRFNCDVDALMRCTDE